MFDQRVSEIHFSCNAVDRGLWLAILNPLLCGLKRTGTFASESKVMYFILLILRSGFDVSFLTSISVSTVVLTQGKVEFLK